MDSAFTKAIHGFRDKLGIVIGHLLKIQHDLPQMARRFQRRFLEVMHGVDESLSVLNIKGCLGPFMVSVLVAQETNEFRIGAAQAGFALSAGVLVCIFGITKRCPICDSACRLSGGNL